MIFLEALIQSQEMKKNMENLRGHAQTSRGSFHGPLEPLTGGLAKAWRGQMHGGIQISELDAANCLQAFFYLQLQSCPCFTSQFPSVITYNE